MAQTSFKVKDYSVYTNRLVKVLKQIKLSGGGSLEPGDLCKVLGGYKKILALRRISDGLQCKINCDEKGYFEVMSEPDNMPQIRHASELK